VSYYGAGAVRRVFLADGDALILRTARLLEILADLRAAFPNLQRVSTYASPQALLAKSVAELTELKAAGLTLHYVGPESGHPEVLRRIAKGVGPDELIDGCRRVLDAGAKLSLIFLLGVGGTELSHEHAVESGRLASAIDPQYLSALTLVPVPGTPIHAEVEAGAPRAARPARASRRARHAAAPHRRDARDLPQQPREQLPPARRQPAQGQGAPADDPRCGRRRRGRPAARATLAAAAVGGQARPR
jgi:radical SAM superfamily enzyme YgiQ (UPF0313 family)